jgi:hypothetical protein
MPARQTKPEHDLALDWKIVSFLAFPPFCFLLSPFFLLFRWGKGFGRMGVSNFLSRYISNQGTPPHLKWNT